MILDKEESNFPFEMDRERLISVRRFVLGVCTNISLHSVFESNDLITPGFKIRVALIVGIGAGGLGAAALLYLPPRSPDLTSTCFGLEHAVKTFRYDTLSSTV